MINNVPGSRIDCETKCNVNFDGFYSQGMIVNLSLSGALVKLDEMIPGTIQPDNMCELMFCANPDLYPLKYTCKVIRVDSEMIGLQFFGLNIMPCAQ